MTIVCECTVYMWALMQQQNTLHTAFFLFSFLKNKKFQLFWNLKPSTDLRHRITTIRGKGPKVSSIHDPKVQQCIKIWWTSLNLVPCRAHSIGLCRPEHQSGRVKCNVGGRTRQKQGWLLSLIFSVQVLPAEQRSRGGVGSTSRGWRLVGLGIKGWRRVGLGLCKVGGVGFRSTAPPGSCVLQWGPSPYFPSI